MTNNKCEGINSKDAENMVNNRADQYLKLKKEAKKKIIGIIKSEQFSKKLNNTLDKAFNIAITKNAQINQGKKGEPVIVLDSYISFDYWGLVAFLHSSKYSLISNDFNKLEEYAWKEADREISRRMLIRGYVEDYTLLPCEWNPIFERVYVWVPIEVKNKGFWVTRFKLRKIIKTRVEKLRLLK